MATITKDMMRLHRQLPHQRIPYSVECTAWDVLPHRVRYWKKRLWYMGWIRRPNGQNLCSDWR